MLRQSSFVKIQIAVPPSHEAAVLKALGDAGAGEQGNYTHCSGTYRAIGRFIPVGNAQPAIGELGQPQKVEESVIQAICHVDNVQSVIAAVMAVHPYEEPAIDILPRLEIES